ncbi:hypothetical protein NDU88_007900 [Pleurodeles waltl]|uniref:Uncharacterized protein n=1 Tax=Pleurodeles waltl TaxID=8319 RepID=A0AAV7QQ96_PLEWA|nr:hypothetical protein NDU88_007900 [Pleurodeles waltl]
MQAAAGSLSVSPAPGAVTPAAPLDKDRLKESSTAPAKANAATEGSGTNALLSRPGKLGESDALAELCQTNAWPQMQFVVDASVVRAGAWFPQASALMPPGCGLRAFMNLNFYVLTPGGA